MERYALVAEDAQVLSSMLKSVLNSQNFVVETARSAAEAKKKLKSFEPDLILLDVLLGPGPSGVDLAYALSSSCPQSAILFLTDYPDLVDAGYGKTGPPSNVGVISKEMITDEAVLRDSVEKILQGQRIRVTPHVDPSSNKRLITKLTPTQTKILRMLAQGYTVTEIARQRGITYGAVEKMITIIYSKLQIPSDGSINPRTEAVRRYIDVMGIPERSQTRSE